VRSVWHVARNPLGEFDLGLGRSAERKAARGGRLNRLNHRRVGVAHDHRPPRAHQVDVAPTVRIPQQRAAGPFDERRRASDRAKRPHRGVHAARDGALGALEKLLVSSH